MPRAAPADLIAFLAPFSDEVHELALGLRERVLTVMPNAHEFVWDATNAVSLAYTPTTRWQDSVVHIASYAKWVNLGFNEGASLDDPLGLLVGTGAHVRHVRFGALRDLEAAWLDDYLRRGPRQCRLPSRHGRRGQDGRACRPVPSAGRAEPLT